jgi:ABC-type phosphate transport system substrate-binding protein
MRGLSLRFASAAAVTAASAVAFIAPGTASAACTGANIEGSGSTLQELAQNEVWRPTFNNKCPGGEHEQVSAYHGIGSGAGLATWNVGKKEHNFGPAFAFVGTDQPPNPTQKSEIELVTGGGKVLSIPTLQAAVAIDIHLPAGCTSAVSGTSKKESKDFKRLSLDEKTIEAIFAHTITKWSEIKDFGDKLLPEGCAGSSEIVRVVREDGSGTTAILKKFLFEINKNPVDPETGETWNDLAEKNKNLPWPEEKVNLERANGGKGVAKLVAEKAGRIGYSNMADARNTHLYTPEGVPAGGDGTPVFWALVQNNPANEKKFIDPSDNKEVNAKSNSNCAGTKYVNLNATGKKAKFPPESTEDAWNEVTAELKQKNYPLCGFTYDLSLTKFSATESEKTAASAAEETTISNYFNYILNEGQVNLLGNDYLGLPNVGSAKKNPLLIARAGAAKIAF